MCIFFCVTEIKKWFLITGSAPTLNHTQVEELKDKVLCHHSPVRYINERYTGRRYFEDEDLIFCKPSVVPSDGKASYRIITFPLCVFCASQNNRGIRYSCIQLALNVKETK